MILFSCSNGNYFEYCSIKVHGKPIRFAYDFFLEWKMLAV